MVSKHRVIKTSIAGGGILSWASKLKTKVEKGMKIGKKIAGVYGSKEFKRLLDFIPSSDERATSGYENEQHAILKVSPTRFGVANYMGSSTHVIERLKRDGFDSFRTPADAVAEVHDISYWLAQLAPTREEQIKLVRQADEHMVKTLKIIKRDKLDYPFNIALGMRLIQAKMIGEDLGALQKASFSGALKKHPEADVKLAKQALAWLKKHGY
jgi:hypothetical protein